MSALAAPVSWADNSAEALNALMMGGSFMPTPSAAWRDRVITDYIQPATGGTYRSVLVPTPESASSSSIPNGLASLQAAMAEQQLNYPGAPYVVLGYSQSAQIAIDEKIRLMQAGQPASDLTLVLLGSGNRPDGGFLERFAGVSIPGAVGFDFNGAEPTHAGITTIDIASQYDAVADFPQYPINLVADLNGLLGFLYVHGGYGNGPLPQEIPAIWPQSEPLTGPFTDHYVLGSPETVQQVDGDTTFYLISTATLPLLDPLRSLGVPTSLLDVVQPALQVIVEAGYDRPIPFGDPTPAQLIPTIDPITFVLEFTKAVVQGADNAFGLFGAHLGGAAPLENLLNEAQSWSAQVIGAPYYQAVSAINAEFNPFTAVAALEGPVGRAVQDLLDQTGIQQAVLDPVLGLVGTLGGLVTS